MKIAALALLILAADAAAASEATCNSEGTAAEQAACCALTEKAPTQARAARRAARDRRGDLLARRRLAGHELVQRADVGRPLSEHSRRDGDERVARPRG